MVKKISVDLPNRYYEALHKVANSPGMAHRLAVFAIAHEADIFEAGELQSKYGMVHDMDYRALSDQPETALGYKPHLKLSFESIVQIGHTGCLIIYDESAVRMGEVRGQVEQLLASQRPDPDQLQAS